MRSALTTALLFLFFSAPISHLGLQQAPPSATTSGSVTDQTEAVIQGAVVRFESTAGTVESVTNNVGEYSATLLPGVYSVSVAAHGFTKLHRSELAISPGQQMKLSFDLSVWSNINQTEEEKLPAAIKANGPLYEETLPPLGASGIKPVIVFGVRDQRGDFLLYAGRLGRSLYDSPCFSFDRFTLAARTLIWNPSTKILEGGVDAKWQDGTSTWRGYQIRISFAGPTPQILLQD
jgi:hypothetical protein